MAYSYRTKVLVSASDVKMKSFIRSLCFISLIVDISNTQNRIQGSRSFKGFQVIRTNATTLEQLSPLIQLYEDDEMDFWTRPSIQRGTDIMIRSDKLSNLKQILNSKKILFNVLISDVDRLISDDEEKNQSVMLRGGYSDEMTWDAYHPYETIMNWLDSLAEQNSNIRLENIGRSSEGRPLKLVHISFSNQSGGKRKPAIWIDSLFHAREWVTGVTTTYLINELVVNSFKYSDLLEKVDFYILPIANPDGYVYSWTTDRMWRKTRSNHGSLLKCRGVDPNRNFSVMFGGPGTRSGKCSAIYRGPHAFSEPETRAVRDFILNSGANFQAYLTVHSYSQLWMYPWGYTKELPVDWKDLDSLAEKSVKAIAAKYGTKYSFGSSTNVLYAAAGGSDDWAKGAANVKYSYTLELRDTGKFGFLLPPSQILPTAEETWDGIQVVARHIS